MRNWFRGLRGKLIITYTLVTVLALLALEVLLLALFMLAGGFVNSDQREYLGDVIGSLAPQARGYLQPGKPDLPGLQAWLEEVATSGTASPPPQGLFDSPAAVIDPSDPLLVIAPGGQVLAQAPRGDLVGRAYTPPDSEADRQALQAAFQGSISPLDVATRTPRNSLRLAVAVRQISGPSPVLGVILVTVRPAPPLISSTWPVFLGWVALTGLLLLAAVAPLGALFGLVMSRGLTRRLTALTGAVDAWSDGDFRSIPPDRSQDEIGVLWMRLRRMAERIQALLATQQQLAALEERNRLARELHDTVKQQNFAALMQVRAARNSLAGNPQAAAGFLTEAEALMKNSQHELGLMVTELRPAALEGQGLAAALENYLAEWSRHARIPAKLQADPPRALPLPAEQALFRVAQEALANVARHSRASAVDVRLSFAEQTARLQISDNGVGFDPQQQAPGFGLQSMRERLAELGGQLAIQSAPEAGTSIEARIPLPGGA